MRYKMKIHRHRRRPLRHHRSTTVALIATIVVVVADAAPATTSQLPPGHRSPCCTLMWCAEPFVTPSAFVCNSITQTGNKRRPGLFPIFFAFFLACTPCTKYELKTLFEGLLHRPRIDNYRGLIDRLEIRHGFWGRSVTRLTF